MNTAKIYKDTENNDRTISQMVKLEPEWAASRIQAGEDALAVIERIKAWDVAQYSENGKFSLPLELREEIQSMCV
jgi:hypothetical protein